MTAYCTEHACYYLRFKLVSRMEWWDENMKHIFSGGGGRV